MDRPITLKQVAAVASALLTIGGALLWLVTLRADLDNLRQTTQRIETHTEEARKAAHERDKALTELATEVRLLVGTLRND